MNFDTFLALARALEARQVDYVLVGGMALAAHGLLRATEDIDLFVATDEGNVERLRAALRSVWDDPEIEGIQAADLAGEYPTVRYGPPDDSCVVDIIARLGTEIAYQDLEVETRLVEGVPVRVATPRTLYRMKRDTVRPIDQADAAALRDRFGLEDS